MTWTSFHRRGDVLRTVVDELDSTRTGVLPMHLDGVTETFGDELTLLGALHLKWYTRLAGLIESSLFEQPADLPGAVRAAWAEAAYEMPGIRAALDLYGDQPSSDAMRDALAKAEAKEWTLLAVMAGLASTSDAAAPAVGRRLAAEASIRRPRRVETPAEVDHHPTVRDWIRAHLTRAA